MQQQKISCSSCPHRDVCATETKLFVNYCGTDISRFKDKIDAAINECRELRGDYFMREEYTSLRDLAELYHRVS